MSQYCTLKLIEDEIVQSFSLDVLTAAFFFSFFFIVAIWINQKYRCDRKAFFVVKKKFGFGSEV